jgi:hypothetical protein
MIKKEKKILQVDKVPVQYIKGDFCNTTICTHSRISDCTKCLEFILNVTIYSNIYQTLKMKDKKKTQGVLQHDKCELQVKQKVASRVLFTSETLPVLDLLQ